MFDTKNISKIYSSPRLSGIRIHNFSDDRNRLHIGSCKSNIQEEEYILDIFFVSNMLLSLIY
jgi:hypothetical protein